MICGCEFDPDPQDSDEDAHEKAWHYLRTCANCGGQWYGLHCPHDGYQNPCPHCGANPIPITSAGAPNAGSSTVR